MNKERESIMRRTFKKMFASLAALAVGVSGLAVGAATAMAAVEPTNTTITLTAADAKQLDGHTFQVVKIADYDVDSTAATVATVANMKAAVTDALTDAGAGTIPGNADPMRWAMENEKLDSSGDGTWLGNSTTRKFADSLRDNTAVKALLAAPVSAVPGSDNLSVTLTMESVGIWLILDENASTGKSSKALPIVVGTPWNKTEAGTSTDLSTGTVQMKNQTIPVSKEVSDHKVGKGNNATYTITSQIPNYVGYKVQGYTFKLADTFKNDVAPTMIGYNENDLTVKVDSEPQALVKGTDYTLTYFDKSNKKVDDGQVNGKATKFTVDLSAYIQKQFDGDATETSVFNQEKSDTKANKAVTITYTAKVKEQLPDDGALNSPEVEAYSNDPSDITKSDKVPGLGQKVFNFPLTIKKVDKVTGAILKGAQFEITGPGITGSTKETVDPSTGLATFDGLDEGKYTVTEILPADDHVLPPYRSFTVTISASVDGVNEAATVKDLKYVLGTSQSENMGGLASQDGATSDKNGFQVLVANVTNVTQLPLTGGMGIALFLTLAVVLGGAGTAFALRARNTKRRLQA
jgi:hypothetical protein